MKFKHVLLALLVTSIWGLNYTVSSEGLKDIPPLLLGSLRFFLTSIPAVFFIKKPNIPYKMILGYGLLMFSGLTAFVFIGIREGISPGLASLLLQVQVFFTLFFAALLLKEAIRIFQIMGAVIAFSGIFVVAAHSHGKASVFGFFLVLLAALCGGFASLIVKKAGQINMVSLVVWASLMAWPPLLAAAFIFEGDKVLLTLYHLPYLITGSLFFSSYIATLFAYASWSWLLRTYPLANVAPFNLMVPIFGMFFSSLFLSESLQGWKIAAGCLVIFGLCVNLLSFYTKGNIK